MRSFSLIGFLVAAGMAVGTAFGAAGASAQDLKVGQAYSGMIEIASKQVPLPAGEWRLASVGANTISKANVAKEDFGAYGTILNLILLRAENGKLDAVAEVNVNALPVNDGWGTSEDCEREDLYAIFTRYKSGWDSSCFFIRHTISAPEFMPAVARDDNGLLVKAAAAMRDLGKRIPIGPASGMSIENTRSATWDDALAVAKAQNLSVPSTWLTVGYRVANRRDVVDLRVHFNPETRGFPVASAASAVSWKDSPWHHTKVEADPTKAALIRDFALWGAVFHDAVERGVKNQLAGEAPIPMPWRNRPPSERDKFDDRLAALEALRAKGKVSDTEYLNQRDRIIEDREKDFSPKIDSTTVALYKALTYRAIVSTLNIGIDLFWIGEIFAAGQLIFLQVTINSVKFYFHELAWEKYGGYKAARRDSPREVDFVYAGVGA
ncbi:MAG TPA: DUF2061 domain-containing protein [Azospirillum sp.]